jgi:uncharacterized Zn finger protein
MMINYSEADIRAGANKQSFDRGYEYYIDGSVLDVTQRGNLLTAQVQGSDADPYDIAITLAADGSIADADCTCPYDRSGYCKHIVAVLLTALDEASEIAVKPEWDTLLAGLSEAQLRRIIRSVAESQPAFAEAIEQQVKWVKMEPGSAPAAGVAPPKHSIVVDTAAIRREMRKDFQRIAESGGDGDYSGYGWDDEDGTIDPEEVLGPHQTLARTLLAAGDAAAATDVIMAMIQGWENGVSGLDDWQIESNEDVLNEAENDLGALLAEALLSQQLSPEQRDQWLARVEDWAKDVISLEIVETALEQWWDYPPLVAAMQGNISERGAWEGAAPDYADRLTLARLHILERQGRTQEYINLAEAEGQFSLFVNMLARSGQVERSVAEARQTTQSPDVMLSLAKVLAERGERAAALAVAEHGLESDQRRQQTELARWTVALAQQEDKPALALRAAQAAFLSSFELADYKVVENLAGAEWSAIKAGLLEQMEQSDSFHKIDLYLYEKMLGKAMALIDRSPYGWDLERVIQATRAEYPDWGIQHCKRQAENIMNAGKANAYDSAVGWLRTARDIYLQHSRQAEWRTYLDGVLNLHQRKYKLVPMLRAIR